MNIFRLTGDMAHLLSIIVLLLKIRATKSCRGTAWVTAWGRSDRLEGSLGAAAPRSLDHLWPGHTAGVSRKTQELYALVFVCRYLDLFYSYISL